MRLQGTTDRAGANSSPAQPGHLWTAEAVARFLAIPRKSVYRLAELGEIPAVRIGMRSLRFDPAAIRQWLSDRTGREATSVGGTGRPTEKV